ncbi:hypothetical protein TGRUB_430280, partial [Toxoplasma gondii RUB]
TASHTPGAAASKESGESSDGHDGDSAASEHPEDVSESSRRQGTSGVAPLTSPEDEASRSTLARRLEKELAQLRDQRRRVQANLRNQRCRWSSEDSYVKYRLKEKPAPSSSPETLARIRAKYRSSVDKKKREMSVVEQSIREMELQEATLRARLLECRRGCSQGPEEPSTEDAAGTSTSASHLQGSADAAEASGGDDDSGVSRDQARHSTQSSSRLASSRGLTLPADSGGGDSGTSLSLEERLKMVRTQKRRKQVNLYSLRRHWLTEAAYVKERTSSAKPMGAKPGVSSRIASCVCTILFAPQPRYYDRNAGGACFHSASVLVSFNNSHGETPVMRKWQCNRL